VFNDLNNDRNIDKFFNTLSFDRDENSDLTSNVADEKDYLNKEHLKNYLVDNTELGEPEINRLSTKWDKEIDRAVTKAENYYAHVKQKAIICIDKAADDIGTMSTVVLIVFLLGTLAAFFVGVTGSLVQTITEKRE
jgi:ribosomal protein S18